MLCVLTVQDSVWVGFEHGFIMVYSARTKQPSLQLWPHGGCRADRSAEEGLVLRLECVNVAMSTHMSRGLQL